MRNYLSQMYQGPRSSQEFSDLWMLAEMLDGQLDIAYRHGGKPAVDWLLVHDDACEHALSRIGAQVAYLRSGDRRVYDAIVTSKPPGESDILPSWALEEARTHSTAMWKQDQRVTGKSSPTPAAPAGAGPPRLPPDPKRKVRQRGKFANGDAAATPQK